MKTTHTTVLQDRFIKLESFCLGYDLKTTNFQTDF